MKKKYLVLTVLMLMISVNLMAGETGKMVSGECIIEKIQKRGVIRVGMSTFVPWAMKDKRGELIGFEIDVARRLAEDMGVKIEFVPTSWSGIIPALLTGKFDVIIGGMGITPKRNLKVNFTSPYDYSGMSMVAHKKKAGSFKSLEDFNKGGVTLAARMGTSAEHAAKKYLPKASLRLFDNESQALQELNLGRIHAVVASAPLPRYQALKYPEKLFVPLSDNFAREPIGFAVIKGDHDTLNFFNNWIKIMKTEGFLKERKHYWFKTKEWESKVM